MTRPLHENGQRIGFEPLGHSELALDTNVVGLPGLPESRLVKRTVIRNLGGDISWTDDGSTPSDTHGMVNLADEIMVYDGDVDDFRFRAASTADVRIIYYG